MIVSYSIIIKIIIIKGFKRTVFLVFISIFRALNVNMPTLHNLVKRLSLTPNMKGPVFIKIQDIYLCDVVVSKLKFKNFRGNRFSSFNNSFIYFL